MRIQIQWLHPLQLRDATKDNMIYSLDLSKVPKEAGVYVFGRRWGHGFEALYVGKAGRVRSRVKGQLNNLRVMQHLRNAKTGRRIVHVGRIITRPGQRLEKTMTLVERALIRYFLSEGHDLVNKQGTRIKRHEISAEGRHPRGFVPRNMFVEKARGE
jgi:hypothetical protein